MPSTDRLPKLQQLLERTPEDTFLHYAIALEYKKIADYPQAISSLRRVIDKDPAYAPAYHQLAQSLHLAGDIPAARTAYQQGIAAARQSGNTHAMQEMEGELMMLD